MRSFKKALSVVSWLLGGSGLAFAQQADTAYQFENRSPAYASNAGPSVCIDEGHSNLHTATGTYAPFAALLRGDGYSVKGLSALTSHALSECRVFVVANAVAEPTVKDRDAPPPPAFSKSEIDILVGWLSDGGALLLIADHSPFAGAVADLGLALGVNMLDAFAAASGNAPGVLTVFGSPNLAESAWRQFADERKLNFERFKGLLDNPGAFGNHPIVRGRNDEERVRWVVTFTGHAFYPSTGVEPLLVFGQQAVAAVNRRDGAMFSIAGWLHAGAVRVGKGRAVIMAEAGACTAQVSGPRRLPTGMNALVAPDNSRFCLNTLHWLTGLLDSPAQ